MRIISDAGLQRRINYTPHAAQQTILDGMKRYTIIAAGRRFGKSNLCGYLALRELLTSNKKIWVVAPNYELTKKTFNYIVGWITRYFPDKSFKVTQSPMPKIECFTGSILEGKSTENLLSLMGEELDLCIVDEASAMSPLVWEMYLYPTLMNRQGKALFISTPKGRNWFYKLYNKGNKDDAEYSRFQYTSKDNPTIPNLEKQWEEAKSSLPKAVFDQEYRAWFLSNAASVFRNVELVATSKLMEPEGGHNYVMGVDLGKYHDFTVITVIDRMNHHVVHWDRFQAIGWPLQIRRIIDTSKKYNDALVNVDATAVGDPIAEELMNAGLSVNEFKYSNTMKNKLILKLSSFIEHQRIRYPDNEILIDELNSFGYNISKEGNTKYSAPEGAHDDCVNSLALAVYELNEVPDGAPETEIITYPTTEY